MLVRSLLRLGVASLTEPTFSSVDLSYGGGGSLTTALALELDVAIQSIIIDKHIIL
ncbi:hypothetical protein NC797_00920 [Aquibacillus sp. 3ASR75-11]|uniref:Uncharacterized protein n=1 Tax=Terrihalobacillus insolitus TaxID=2950438 RepID=A0A9X4AKA2_9BACI|nr:hypothetical protein [Terrihalobacillus insolitus]MDC3412239.1 hypothetical protein [Terrihalobacillus insolitus]MDC3423067.1 hypothetical protein [Terrihalobacillus insolitus]